MANNAFLIKYLKDILIWVSVFLREKSDLFF